MAGFEDDLTVAFIGSKVPVILVRDKKAADFEITGRHLQRRGSGFSQDVIEEATITVTDVKAGVVLDAYTLTAGTLEKLARACAQRFQDRVALPLTQSAAVHGPVAVLPLPSSAGPRLFVQGDFNRLADFIDTLRVELRGLGVAAEVVQRGDNYDYNIVFVQTDTNAAAVAIDPHGLLVVSAVDTAFRAKGATEGSARKLARLLAPLSQR